jgi:hypothetical protein
MACGLFSEDEDNKGEPSRNSGDALAPPVVPEKQRKRKAKRNNAREQHKKLQEQALQAKRELKAQRRDADNSKRLVAEIEVEEEERLRHIRRRQVCPAASFTEFPFFRDMVQLLIAYCDLDVFVAPGAHGGRFHIWKHSQ